MKRRDNIVSKSLAQNVMQRKKFEKSPARKKNEHRTCKKE